MHNSWCEALSYLRSISKHDSTRRTLAAQVRQRTDAKLCLGVERFVDAMHRRCNTGAEHCQRPGGVVECSIELVGQGADA